MSGSKEWRGPETFREVTRSLGGVRSSASPRPSLSRPPSLFHSLADFLGREDARTHRPLSHSLAHSPAHAAPTNSLVGAPSLPRPSTNTALLHNTHSAQVHSHSGHGFVQDWAFTALCFNMFCRGVSTAQIQLGCLLPTSDGFLVDLVASKTHLVGQKCERKNVAGNPLDPSVCPRLALAVCLAL